MGVMGEGAAVKVTREGLDSRRLIPGGPPSGTVCSVTPNPRLPGGTGPQPQGLGTLGNSWPTT